jgi:hypothetical protein
MADLIGSVKVTPPQAVPGQSVHVHVLDLNGTPYTADSDVTVALDGIPVPSRYYQFPTAGTRTISAYAAGHGKTETKTATVDVTGAPLVYHRTLFAAGEPAAPGLMPFIVLTQDLATPYQVTFSLATPPAARAAAAREVAARAQAAAEKANAGEPAPAAAAAAQKAPEGFLALKALFSARSEGSASASRQHLVLEKPVTLPAPSTSYIWTFGDGQTVTTDTPSVIHDYFPAITPGQVPFAFDVQCNIVHDSISVTRTLVLYSPYGMCQRNGVTVPHVTSDAYATLNSARTSFSTSLLVYNIEATAITIDQMAIVPVWNDAAASFPAFAFKKMTQPVAIAAHSSSLLAVQVLRSDLSSAAKGAAITGFIVAFQGTLAPPPALPSADVALENQLSPGRIAFLTVAANTVRFSQLVRLHLQDQQLPPPPLVSLPPVQVLLNNLGKAAVITDPVVRGGSVAVDAATNVVSVGLSTRAPTPSQAAQVRHAVLSVLNAATQ